MKIRTLYLKSNQLEKSKEFWRSFLGLEPHKDFENWVEFKLDNINLGIWSNDGKDSWHGSSTVPVFEFNENEVIKYIDKAKKLGALILIDALEDPKMKSVVMSDPTGCEFEISKYHD